MCREFSVPFSLQGGSGSSIDFGGTTNYSDNFSKNFGLNLSAIVADGEFLDDAEVTGRGWLGVSNGYGIGAETI